MSRGLSTLQRRIIVVLANSNDHSIERRTLTKKLHWKKRPGSLTRSLTSLERRKLVLREGSRIRFITCDMYERLFVKKNGAFGELAETDNYIPPEERQYEKELGAEKAGKIADILNLYQAEHRVRR